MGHHHHSHNPHHGNNPHNAPHNTPSNTGKLPTGPAPQSAKRSGFFGRLRERIREPDATKEGIEQLELNTKREEYKTRMHIAKAKRPSKFGNLVFGSQSPPQRSYGRSSRQAPRENDSWLFSNDSHSSGFGSESFGSGLNDMLGMGSSQNNSRKKKYQKSGLEEMF